MSQHSMLRYEILEDAGLIDASGVSPLVQVAPIEFLTHVLKEYAQTVSSLTPISVGGTDLHVVAQQTTGWAMVTNNNSLGVTFPDERPPRKSIAELKHLALYVDTVHVWDPIMHQLPIVVPEMSLEVFPQITPPVFPPDAVVSEVRRVLAAELQYLCDLREMVRTGYVHMVFDKSLCRETLGPDSSSHPMIGDDDQRVKNLYHLHLNENSGVSEELLKWVRKRVVLGIDDNKKTMSTMWLKDQNSFQHFMTTGNKTIVDLPMFNQPEKKRVNYISYDSIKPTTRPKLDKQLISELGLQVGLFSKGMEIAQTLGADLLPTSWLSNWVISRAVERQLDFDCIEALLAVHLPIVDGADAARVMHMREETDALSAFRRYLRTQVAKLRNSRGSSDYQRQAVDFRRELDDRVEELDARIRDSKGKILRGAAVSTASLLAAGVSKGWSLAALLPSLLQISNAAVDLRNAHRGDPMSILWSLKRKPR